MTMNAHTIPNNGREDVEVGIDFPSAAPLSERGWVFILIWQPGWWGVIFCACHTVNPETKGGGGGGVLAVDCIHGRRMHGKWSAQKDGVLY